MNNKEIVIGTLAYFEIRTGKDITHHVTNVNVDIYNATINIVIENGIEVNQVKMSIPFAKEIGFINFDALKPFCK